MTSRAAEHLAWCKERALEYIDHGMTQQAFTSMASDLTKHDDTRDLVDVVTQLGMPLLIAGQLSTPEQMREWIEGFGT